MATKPRRRGNADLTPEVAIVQLDVGVIMCVHLHTYKNKPFEFYSAVDSTLSK